MLLQIRATINSKVFFLDVVSFDFGYWESHRYGAGCYRSVAAVVVKGEDAPLECARRFQYHCELIGEVRPTDTMVMRLLDEFVVLLTKYAENSSQKVSKVDFKTIDEVCGWDPRLALSGLLAINISYGEKGEGLYKKLSI
ncbi:hypothetical protein Tco_0415518 [Tanacetum coccineum]